MKVSVHSQDDGCWKAQGNIIRKNLRASKEYNEEQHSGDEGEIHEQVGKAVEIREQHKLEETSTRRT